MDYINSSITNLYFNTNIILSSLIVIVHIICALAVSKDLGNFAKRNITPQLMPNIGWIISTLTIGVWGLFIYWTMHHSALSRK